MLEREATLVGEQHSSERTPFVLNEGSSSEGTPSSSHRQPRVVAIPVTAPLPVQPPRKRKYPSLSFRERRAF